LKKANFTVFLIAQTVKRKLRERVSEVCKREYKEHREKLEISKITFESSNLNLHFFDGTGLKNNSRLKLGINFH